MRLCGGCDELSGPDAEMCEGCGRQLLPVVPAGRTYEYVATLVENGQWVVRPVKGRYQNTNQALEAAAKQFGWRNVVGAKRLTAVAEAA